MLRLIVCGGLLGASAIAASWSTPAPAHGSEVRLAQGDCATGAIPVSGGERTYADFDVDEPPKARRGNPKPRFPSSLDEAPSAEYESIVKDRVSGEVVMRFVVDAYGCVDLSSVTVLATTDSAFTREVIRVLPKYKFTPAKKAGENVRSWMSWKFLFYKNPGARPPV